jgi:hypothetical protein
MNDCPYIVLTLAPDAFDLLYSTGEAAWPMVFTWFNRITGIEGFTVHKEAICAQVEYYIDDHVFGFDRDKQPLLIVTDPALLRGFRSEFFDLPTFDRAAILDRFEASAAAMFERLAIGAHDMSAHDLLRLQRALNTAIAAARASPG